MSRILPSLRPWAACALALCLAPLASCSLGARPEAAPSDSAASAQPSAGPGSAFQERTSSANPAGPPDAQARQEDPEPPQDSSQVERGPSCSPEDLLVSPEPEDIDSTTSREVALSEADLTLPASPHVVVPASPDVLAATVVRVAPGARTVEVNASATTVVVEGDIDSLVVNGSANTVWVLGVGQISYAEDSGANYVFWDGPRPTLSDAGVGNAVARADYAVQVRLYC